MTAERFETLVLPEVELLLRVARSLTRDTAAAEDLVQDTLLRAFRAIDRFDGAHPRAWLLTIMRNAHTNNHRRRRPELLADGERPHDAPDPTVDVEAEALDATLDRRVGEALAALPEPFREVVLLVDVQGLAYAEAAALLDIPVGTVMSRLHRARRRLREALERAGVEPRSLR